MNFPVPIKHYPMGFSIVDYNRLPWVNRPTSEKYKREIYTARAVEAARKRRTIERLFKK